MSTYLDLDDVTAGHPVALEELVALRKEIDALRTENTERRAWQEQAVLLCAQRRCARKEQP